MPSTPELPRGGQSRSYDRQDSVVFLKTRERFGGLSNMAGGFPLAIQGTRIHSAEALYQACRFPHLPEIQQLIIEQASPMTAKMKSKPHREHSRSDWYQVRVKVMRWCLRVKLAQNWPRFSELLLQTGDRPIVEESRKDDFWGAKPVGDHKLVGFNVLGRLLMELREAVKSQGAGGFASVEPPDVANFLLLGRIIGVQNFSKLAKTSAEATSALATSEPRQGQEQAAQAVLFDELSVREPPAAAYLGSPAPEPRASWRLGRHSSLKNSGVDWLGDVPEHWEIQPARLAFRPKLVKNEGLREQQVLSLSYGRILVKPTEKLRGLVPESFETYQIVDPGDIIVRATDLQNDQTSLRVGYSRHRGIITSAYLNLTTTARVSSEFGYQVLNAYDLLKIIYGYGSGLRQNLDFSHIKHMPVPIPPLDEQRAIVRFLDHVDRRIRRYVRAKQKLIRLLEEQKQAIIHRAVTRGLDPNVRLKPSGVEWLGDVPEHWELVPNRAFMRLQKRVVGKASGNFTLLSLTKHGVIQRDMENPEGKFPASFDTYQEVLPGDLVFCLFDIDETPRAVGLSTLHGMVTGAYTRFTCDPSVVDWVYLFYLAMDNGKRLKPLYTGLRKVITKSSFLSAKFPLPPKRERCQLLHEVKRVEDLSEAGARRAQREIDLLLEYRTRLIADVVTGKVDVREVAAELPLNENFPEEVDGAIAGPEATEGGEEGGFAAAEDGGLLEVAEGEE